MIVHSPMTRLLTQRALRLVLALFVLIVAVFIADTFTSQLEEVLRQGGGALDLALILLLRTPEVVDFALPIILFLGLFLAITGARNDNELVICAAAGERWQKIPRLALTLGVLAMLVSLLFAGVVQPVSSYLLRLTYHELTARRILTVLNDPGGRSHIRTIENRTIIASPPSSPDVRRGSLFVYTPEPDGGWRVARADDWELLRSEDGGYKANLKRFREYRGRSNAAPTADSGPRGQAPVQATLDFATVRVQTLELAFRVEDVVQSADRARRFGERFLFQAGGPLDGPTITRGGAPVAAPTRALGEILARALMCPVAAAMAVAMAAFAATRRGRYLGLPVGLILVMAGDVGSRALLGDAAGLGYPRFWPALTALLALGLAPTLGYVWMRAEAIVIPSRGAA